MTSVTVTVTLGEIVDFDPTRECILREYDIAIPAGTYTNATLRFHYQDNELNAFDEPFLGEYKFNSGVSWDSIGYTTRNAVTNYVEKTAITTGIIGRWTLSGLRNVVRWNGSVSSAWETAANWTTISGSNMSNRVPTSTDAAQIGNGAFNSNPTIASTQTVNVLRYGSVQGSTLTISSGSLTIIGSIRGLWTASASHTLDVGSGALTVGTDFILSDGTSGHDILLKIGSGSTTITSDLIQSASGGVNFTVNGTLTIGGQYTYTAGSFTCGTGTVIYSGTEAQTVAHVTYNNLSFTKSTERAFISVPTTVNGNLTTSIGGELDISDTLTVTGNITIGASTTLIETDARINVAGNWTTNGTFTVGSGSVNFNGTGSQTVNANTFNTMLINKSSGTLSVTGNLILNNNLTLTSGTFDLSTYTADRSNPGGILTLGAATTLKVGGGTNFPGNYITNTISNTNTVEYNGTIAQNVADVDYGNLTFTGGGATAKTLVGSILINGDLLINSGATIDPSSYTINLAGNMTHNGTYTPSTSTLILTGTSKIISGTSSLTLYNLTASGGSYTVSNSTISLTGNIFVDVAPSAISFGTGTVTLDGDLTNKGSLTSSGTLNISGTRLQTLSLIGAITSSSTGIVNFNGTVLPVTNSTTSPSFYTVNINNTGGAFSPSQPWTVVLACNIASGVTVDFGAVTHTFLGNFTNNGTVLSSGKLKFSPVGAPFPSSGTVTLSASGASFTSTGEVEFAGTGAITLAGITPTLNNVTVTNTNAAGITPSTNWTIGQDLYIGPGAIFHSGSAFSHTIGGNVTNNGTLNGGTSTITFTGGAALIDGVGTGNYNNLTIATAADLTLNKSLIINGNLVNNGNFTAIGRGVTFSGTGTSTISGSTGLITFDDLEQNKTGAVTTLSIPIIVTGDLTMTDGIINTTATNILTLNDNATSTSGTSTSYVNGPIKKIGDDAFVFPLGNSTYWARLEIGAPAAVTDAFTAQYFAAPYANTTTMAVSPTPVLNNVSVIEYWTCNRTAGTSNVPVKLYWQNATRSGIAGYTSDLVIARWNGSAWENAGQSAITGSSPGDVTSNSVSSFSPFTFGSRTGYSPLPIELVSFTAVPTKDVVELEWTTATEINNDFFTIERSKDAIEFFQATIVKGAGNSNKNLHYKTTDENPFSGISYYRLKQTDFDGHFSYSSIKTVHFLNGEFDFNIFPNPANSGNATIELMGKEGQEILVVLYDAQGKEVYTKIQLFSKTGETQISIDPSSKLPSGIYFVVASSDNKLISKKLIIK